jgi:hypothetical protein
MDLCIKAKIYKDISFALILIFSKKIEILFASCSHKIAFLVITKIIILKNKIINYLFLEFS